MARALRQLPDRALHPLRRRMAHSALSAHRLPERVLVVCHGNICRSPYAAAALRRLLAPVAGRRVVSAGFIGPGRPSPPEAISVAAARGVDLSGHRSQVLRPSDVRAADLILVMDAAQRQAICHGYGRKARDVLVLGDLDPGPVATRAIPDPVNQPYEAFETSYAKIDRCLRSLAAVLGSEISARGA